MKYLVNPHGMGDLPIQLRNDHIVDEKIEFVYRRSVPQTKFKSQKVNERAAATLILTSLLHVTIALSALKGAINHG